MSHKKKKINEVDYKRNLVIVKIKKKLNQLEIKRNSKVILFFSVDEIDYYKALDFLNILRKEPKINQLDLILESSGGDLVMAVKIAHICKSYSEVFTVIVPFYAKSAASIIALSADNLILNRAGELGPIDPQVKHPAFDMFFPASSIKNALEFIESSKDPYIKMTMADKLDPLLIGAYNQTIEESKQYLSELPKIDKCSNKEEIIKVFTEKYVDHGYPITYKICKQLNLNFVSKLEDQDEENLIYDIHELVIDFLNNNELEGLTLSQNALKVYEFQEEELEKLPEELE
ncbi:MAG: SDH family Clp fold serine proteinase [Candidatus Helarchaeota archaeon]